MSETQINELGGKTVKNIVFVDEKNYVRKALAILKHVGNLRLIGETGTGKSTFAYKLAELTGKPLFEISLTRDISRWDLLACDTLKEGETKARRGIVLKWLESKEGGILFVDEFNFGENGVVSLFNSLSDFRGNVWIPELEQSFQRSKDHYLIIAYNPTEKSGYCLAKDSAISTPQQKSLYRNINLINIGDYVFDKSNQKQKVMDTNIRNYKGKLYTIKAKSILPIHCSDDHTFIIAERRLKIVKNPTWSHKKNTYEYKLIEKQAKDLKVYTKEDYGITSIAIDTLIFPKHKIETESKTPLDLAWLYGLFVADGSTNKNDNKIAFCLGSHEKDLIQKVTEILETYHYNYYFVKQTNETRIVLTGKKLREFLRENFGTYAENKQIPQFIMDSTKEITKAFLEGYIDGDGFIDDKQTQIKTVSKNLILGLQRLYSKLDILLSIQTIQPKNSKLTKGYKLKLQYLGRFGKTVKTTHDSENFYLPIVKITTEDFNGKLYDITTQTNRFLVNNIIIHNSGTFIQNIATMRRFEGLVVDYLSETEETKVVKTFSGNYNFARKFVMLAGKTRKLYKEGKLRTPLTTGNLINYAKMWKDHLSEEEIIEIAKSLYPEDEWTMFTRLYEETTKLDLKTLKAGTQEQDSS